ncbi:iron-only hydrogenase maturation rSAM protein HydE [Thermanaerovibrio velox DSM 12556]|uniref:Iron-only hydrogenase maturation rSAM protein HydE n=1 Tax=Thermanaerovibrio velox DSM 12556 TaxID=926567 RepID=H0UR03_9BACT|nr:[FeFe] hydrogenase H-cluster radical SAM maturase HydE [Thermanaerovibrio velox]EHM10840.1 iron-only hydrogenase maturation rSAM protein HydE [Thermanaerovibrio velox DSM 12556]
MSSHLEVADPGRLSLEELRQLVDAMVGGYLPTLDQMEGLLSLDREGAELLFQGADRVKRSIFGDEVHIRGIIEFSSHCSGRCLYCGLRADNRGLERYRMGEEEIVSCAREAIDAGYMSLVLQSGEDGGYTREVLGRIIGRIKSYKDVGITLSIGERTYEDYRYLRDAGADRFLMKHETCDEVLYDRLHPHSSFRRRMECLRQLKELGYQVGSGFMVGLPGQSLRSIVLDVLLLRKLDVDMAGIGPFISHPGTPLGDSPNGDPFLALKTVALARLVCRRPHLPATTALGVLDRQGRDMAFFSGANVVMQKLEPHRYRRMYEIYPKPHGEDLPIAEERRRLEALIEGLGLKVSKGRGDAVRP